MFETYRPVRSLLASMLPWTTLKVNVDSMNNVEEVLHDRDFFVHPAGWNGAFSAI